MKLKNTTITLLIAFIMASCAPATKIVPAAVITKSSTITPILPTPTNTPAPSATPIPSATTIPFNISGNFAVADQDFIYIYSVDGEKLRPIQTAGYVSGFEFSRQGRIVAYSAFNMINNDLFYFPYGLKTYRLDNNKRNNIVDDNTRVLGFFWDETSERLIYLTLNGVYSVSMADDMKKETLFRFSAGIFANSNESSFDVYPSPNHQGFVVTQSIRKQVGENRFQDNGFNVYYLSIGKNIAKKLNDEPYQSSGANKFGEWSPDSNYFYYRAMNSENKVKFYVFNASTASLEDGYSDSYPLLWSPDSSFVSQINWEYQGRVLINSGDLSMDWNEIYSYSERSYLTNMAWSSDSDFLAINDGSWLKVYNTQKTQVEPLSNSLSVKPRRIIWSPDGEYLVITDSEEITLSMTKCKFQIYSFSKNELVSVPDIACRGVESFHWLLDGKSLAFTSYSKYSSQEIKTSTVYILDAESATISDINVESIEFELIP